jgi:hypothetical protein
METLKKLEELEELDKLDSEKEFFFTKIDETYLLKEKIKDLECLLKSLRIENERLIDENIKLIDEKKNT